MMTNKPLPKTTFSTQVGFTLIEIMVVLAIMGAMVAVIGLNLKPNLDRLARLEATRFQTVVDEVRDEAIITGQSFFLIVDKKAYNYRFQGVRADRDSSQDEGLFRVRTMRDGVELDWEVLEQLEDSEGKLIERVLITSLGEITPFEARFRGSEYDYNVFVNEQSNLEVRAENAYRAR